MGLIVVLGIWHMVRLGLGVLDVRVLVVVALRDLISPVYLYIPMHPIPSMGTSLRITRLVMMGAPCVFMTSPFMPTLYYMFLSVITELYEPLELIYIGIDYLFYIIVVVKLFHHQNSIQNF
jgi:hypothetical protein